MSVDLFMLECLMKIVEWLISVLLILLIGILF